MTSRALAKRPHRVLALVTDAFGSAGGIAHTTAIFSLRSPGSIGLTK